MSTTPILRLHDYRDRRAGRTRLAESLYRADPGRWKVLEHLEEVVREVGGDRAATVWVDEYGPGLVHPHTVLDVRCDRPRRAFSLELLRRAWDSGVPGFCDATDGSSSRFESVDAPRSAVVVALGSDGTRAWFLVADGVSARPPLSEEVRQRVMFLAGECSAVVLHRDLEMSNSGGSEESGEGKPRHRFAGWGVLQDIDGREADEVASHTIALRFIVARLPRTLVDDDLEVPPDRVRDQAKRAREEVEANREDLVEPREVGLWHAVLDAYEAGDLEALSVSLVRLGEVVEDMGHEHGCRELYRTAYEIAMITGAVEPAIEAARFSGRVARRMAHWVEAVRWYGVAKGVAQAAERPGKEAIVLDGLANVHQERGNFPAARDTLAMGLAIARGSGDATSMGTLYHSLMNVEARSGRRGKAIEYGWRAVTTLPERKLRLRALVGLATNLREAGEIEAAEDAYRVVAELDRESYYQIYALDALGHVAALRGDAAGFAKWSADADALGWENGAKSAKAELLYYRGLSYEALGERALAEAWLVRAVRFAEAHGFNEFLMKAEAELERVRAARTPSRIPGLELDSLPEIRDGLREMRREVAQLPG